MRARQRWTDVLGRTTGRLSAENRALRSALKAIIERPERAVTLAQQALDATDWRHALEVPDTGERPYGEGPPIQVSAEALERARQNPSSIGRTSHHSGESEPHG